MFVGANTHGLVQKPECDGFAEGIWGSMQGGRACMSHLLGCSCCCRQIWLRCEQHENGQAALRWEQPHLWAELEV